MKKGSIIAGKKDVAVYCGGTFSMKGGSITARNSEYGIRNYTTDRMINKVTISGGKITCISTTLYGIDFGASNLTMTGGTIKIKSAYRNGMSCAYVQHGTTKYGGKIVIKGGSVTVLTRGNDGSAIAALSLTAKPGCLKKLRGLMPNGKRA